MSSSSAVSSSSVFVASSSSLVAVSSSASQVSSAASSSVAPVGCEVSDTRLDLNDVSFLFPLPKNDDELNAMLDLDSPGLGGELAREDQQTEPLLVAILNRDSELRDMVKVVGVRIDPCAPTADENICGKEIRLVLQPIGVPGGTYNKHFILGEGEASKFTATDYIGIDQVLHYMYVLTDENFALLTQELKALKALAGAETSCVPLSIHPIIAREGLAGPYARKLMGIIQRYAGEDNLQRIAFTAARPTPLWFFGEMHRETGFDSAKAVSIPRLGGRFATLQFAPAADPQDHRIKGIFNVGQGSALRALAFLDDSAEVDQSLVNSALQETFMIENPKLSNPTTIDCVSCHVSERLREQTIESPRIMVDQAIWQDRYENSRYDLTPTTDGLSFASLRMFGYMLETPNVSQRVVNDSAESADVFNAME